VHRKRKLTPQAQQIDAIEPLTDNNENNEGFKALIVLA